MDNHNFLVVINFHHEWRSFSPKLSAWSSFLHLSLSTSLMTLDIYLLTTHICIPTRPFSSLELYTQLSLHHSLFDLGWWQHHPSSCSAKILTSSLTLFFHTSHPPYQEILLTRPSEYIQTQTPSCHLHCCRVSLSAHLLWPGLLQ